MSTFESCTPVDKLETSSRSGASPPVITLRDQIRRCTQTRCLGGLALPPRATIVDRSRSPLQVHLVHFRPVSWPKGGDSSKISMIKARPFNRSPFQCPVEGQLFNTTQPLARAWQTSSRATTSLKRGKCEQDSGALFPFHMPVGFWKDDSKYPIGQTIRQRVKSTATKKRKTIGSVWCSWNLETHPNLPRIWLTADT